MGQEAKQPFKFFAHDVAQGKTLFTLQSIYGNDGYAFWYKLLELLAAENGQYFDCRTAPSWRYLISKMSVEPNTASEILNLLAEIEAIDSGLWAQRVIWCQNFVDRHKATYSKCRAPVPQRPYIDPTTEELVTPSTPHEVTTQTQFFEESFKQFWDAYPKNRRVKKPLARNRWNALRPTPELVGRILNCLERNKATEDWTKQNGQYVPHPSTWIGNRPWEDEAQPPEPEPDDLDFLN